MQPIPHSQKEIRERREKILLLMSKGLNQVDIAKELNTTRQTIIRDMKAINTYTNDNLNDLAKATLSTMYYYSCITGLNEILKECWQIYNMKDDNNNDGHNHNNNNHLSWWHKIALLKLATEINYKKFDILANGLAILELKRLEDGLTALKNEII